MIEEANKLLGMKDLRKVVMGKSRASQKKEDPAEAEGGNVLNCSEERANRESWKHPLDFLFSCISVSVGLGSKQWPDPILKSTGNSIYPTIFLKILLFRRLALPLSVLQERRWCLPYHLLHLDAFLRCPCFSARSFAWPISRCWRNDYYLPDLSDLER